jgi:hypothetical protein
MGGRGCPKGGKDDPVLAMANEFPGPPPTTPLLLPPPPPIFGEMEEKDANWNKDVDVGGGIITWEVRLADEEAVEWIEELECVR